MIIPLEPDHILELTFQPGQHAIDQTRETAETLAGGYRAMTAVHNGGPLACAGLIEVWAGRALAWAALDVRAGRVLTEITRRMREELDAAPFRRVEMYVYPGFAQAARWAFMLGFEFEAVMVAGAPTGEDLLVFRRLRRASAREVIMGGR